MHYFFQLVSFILHAYFGILSVLYKKTSLIAICNWVYVVLSSSTVRFFCIWQSSPASNKRTNNPNRLRLCQAKIGFGTFVYHLNIFALQCRAHVTYIFKRYIAVTPWLCYFWLCSFSIYNSAVQ